MNALDVLIWSLCVENCGVGIRPVSDGLLHCRSTQSCDREQGRGLLDVGDTGAGISNAAGVIGRHEQDRFARALFRMSRGNTFTSLGAKVGKKRIVPTDLN